MVECLKNKINIYIISTYDINKLNEEFYNKYIVFFKIMYVYNSTNYILMFSKKSIDFLNFTKNDVFINDFLQNILKINTIRTYSPINFIYRDKFTNLTDKKIELIDIKHNKKNMQYIEKINVKINSKNYNIDTIITQKKFTTQYLYLIFLLDKIKKSK